MSFVIDEPEPQPKHRALYGLPLMVYIVGAAGETKVYGQHIVFPETVVLRPGEHVEVRIMDPDGRITR